MTMKIPPSSQHFAQPATAQTAIDQAASAGQVKQGEVSLTLDAQQMARFTKTPLTNQQMDLLFKDSQSLKASQVALTKNPQDASAIAQQTAAKKGLNNTLAQATKAGGGQDSSASRFAPPKPPAAGYPRYKQASAGPRTLIITRFRRIW